MKNHTDNKNQATPNNKEFIKEKPEVIEDDKDPEAPDPLPFLSEEEKTALRNAGLPIDDPRIQDMLRKCPD